MFIDTNCDECGRDFTAPGPPYKTICPKCEKKTRKDRKIGWLIKRRFNEKENREFTIEERIDWIEEWIFEHKDEIKQKYQDFPIF